VSIYAGILLVGRRGRAKAGLPTDPPLLIALRVAGLAVILLAVVLFANQDRGIPYVLVVLAVLFLGWTFVLNRTRFGRHVYAVGGNAEAARRAGINVTRVRLSCFMLCSTLAAVAGILLSSRVNSVSPTTGGSLTLLYAVGAAVIGGTSLFGGKGRIVDAVIGGAVVAVIANGMALLNQPAGRVYIVTGLVLLLAASVDAISRQRAAATGRG